MKEDNALPIFEISHMEINIDRDSLQGLFKANFDRVRVAILISLTILFVTPTFLILQTRPSNQDEQARRPRRPRDPRRRLGRQLRGHLQRARQRKVQ